MPYESTSFEEDPELVDGILMCKQDSLDILNEMLATRDELKARLATDKARRYEGRQVTETFQSQGDALNAAAVQFIEAPLVMNNTALKNNNVDSDGLQES